MTGLVFTTGGDLAVAFVFHDASSFGAFDASTFDTLWAQIPSSSTGGFPISSSTTLSSNSLLPPRVGLVIKYKR